MIERCIIGVRLYRGSYDLDGPTERKTIKLDHEGAINLYITLGN